LKIKEEMARLLQFCIAINFNFAVNKDLKTALKSGNIIKPLVWCLGNKLSSRLEGEIF
jgi:hypothetical protein